MSQASRCGLDSHATRVASHCSIRGQNRCFVFVDVAAAASLISAFRAAATALQGALQPFKQASLLLSSYPNSTPHPVVTLIVAYPFSKQHFPIAHRARN